MQSSDGFFKYKPLPGVIRSVLVLAQTNAKSECILSINARIVTQERALLGKTIIVGLYIFEGAVCF